ncbi:MAG: ABC transporter permease subunit [Myxococcus sp.]|nr:ABC transporter permease subunit [Myxococcus sp.]
MSAQRLVIFRGALRTRRTGLLIWALSLAGVCGLYTALYPSMEKVDLEGMLKALPPAMVEALGYDDMSSAAGYVGSAIYGLVGFMLLLVFAIITGGGVLAGEEDRGTLELELTCPVSRRDVYLQRLAALWAQVAVLVVSVLVVTLGLSLSLSLGIEVGVLVRATVQLLLLVGFFASLAYAAGAATGRPGVARGLAAALAVTSYMFNALGPTVGQRWMVSVSPVGWYMADNPLTSAWRPLDTGLLAASSVVVVVIGWLRFSRRDLMA